MENPSPSSPAVFPRIKSSTIERLRYVYQTKKFVRSMQLAHGDQVILAYKGEELVMFFSPKGAQAVLTLDTSSVIASAVEPFTALTGPGSLWVIDGERHRSERQLLSPGFQPRSYRKYGEMIRDAVRAQSNTWSSGQEIKGLDEMLAISLNVILNLVFGLQGGPLVERGRNILPQMIKSVKPIIALIPDFQVGWFPPWRRYRYLKSEFADWVHDLLEQRRTENRETQDVLGLMLAGRYADGSSMTDEEIRDELLTILLAGHETTATALAWALYELARHPEIAFRLREEIEAIGAERPVEKVVRLPYLNAVCNETLRRHTLLAEVSRISGEPVRVLHQEIQEGILLVVSILAIHNDPEIYPNPERFDPERFLKRKYSPFEFLPFGGGHRRCIGAGLSDFEMRIALAEMITKWDFEILREEIDIRRDIAMGPKFGVPLRVRPAAG